MNDTLNRICGVETELLAEKGKKMNEFNMQKQS